MAWGSRSAQAQVLPGRRRHIHCGTQCRQHVSRESELVRCSELMFATHVRISEAVSRQRKRSARGRALKASTCCSTCSVLQAAPSATATRMSKQGPAPQHAQSQDNARIQAVPRVCADLHEVPKVVHADEVGKACQTLQSGAEQGKALAGTRHRQDACRQSVCKRCSNVDAQLSHIACG